MLEISRPAPNRRCLVVLVTFVGLACLLFLGCSDSSDASYSATGVRTTTQSGSHTNGTTAPGTDEGDREVSDNSGQSNHSSLPVNAQDSAGDAQRREMLQARASAANAQVLAQKLQSRAVEAKGCWEESFPSEQLANLSEFQNAGTKLTAGESALKRKAYAEAKELFDAGAALYLSSAEQIEEHSLEKLTAMLENSLTEEEVSKVSNLKVTEGLTQRFQDAVDWHLLRISINSAKTFSELKKLEKLQVSSEYSQERDSVISRRANFFKNPKYWSQLRELSGHEASISFLRFSEDGTQIVSAAYDKTIRVWSAATGQEMKNLFVGGEYGVGALALHPDATQVAVALTRRRDFGTLDLSSEKGLKKFEGHTGYVFSLAYNRDGTQLVSTSEDKSVRIWDAKSGKELRTMTGHWKRVASADFNHDGSLVASGGHDGSVRIWDAKTGKQLHELSEHTAEIWSVDFNHDGTLVASAARDGTIRLWDPKSGKETRKIEGTTFWLYSLSFSHDGTKVAVGYEGGFVSIWDVKTGEEIAKLHTHTNTVLALAFSPDDTQIVCAGQDKTVKIWGAK